LDLFLVEKHIGILSVLFGDGPSQLGDDLIVAFVPLIVETFDHTDVVPLPALAALMNDKTIKIKHLKIFDVHVLVSHWLCVSLATYFGVTAFLNFSKIQRR